MSGDSNATSYCFRCQHYPESDEEPLKRCARCRSRRYCSKTCQQNDWDRHKAECAILAAGGQAPPRMRSTMRLTMADLMNLADQADDGPPSSPDTIYYVRSRWPHIEDVSIAGPFLRLEDVAENMRTRLSWEKSDAGVRNIDEIVASGQLGGLVHLNAPLPDGHILKLEVIHEQNAAVARTLPGDAWTVVISTPSPAAQERGPGPRHGHLLTKNMEVHKTFTNAEEANAEARRLLREIDESPGKVVSAGTVALQNGLIHGGARTADGLRLVVVSHDSGAMTDLAA